MKTEVFDTTELRRRIEHHENIIKELKSAKEILDKYNNLSAIPQLPEHGYFIKDAIKEQEEDKAKLKQGVNKTFAMIVEDIISEANKPLKGREIYSIGGNQFNPSYYTFSAQLSIRAKKGKLMKHVVENAKNEDKYFYGLPSFFDSNGKLKQEYLDKLG